MFKRGLGELPILRHKGNTIMLGNLVMDKGVLVFRDRGIVDSVSPINVAPCWDLGIVGAIADIKGNEWESLSFLGPDHCHIPVNLSKTRGNVLGRVIGMTGENLLSFYGSAYRGFKLMLDSNLLPLILPFPIKTKKNVTGLAVTDFKFATVSIDTLSKANELVRIAVERHMTLSVDEIDVTKDEFDKMFKQFKH